MRIISGYYKGRRLHPPRNLPVRPTTDRARESLFNILKGYFEFETVGVLDLFAGTGSISYEFISRGCACATAVDIHHQCIKFMKATREMLMMEKLTIVKEDVFRFIKYHKGNYNLIFADPPYDLKNLDMLPQLILNSDLYKETCMLVLEHPSRYSFSKFPGFLEIRSYSMVNFSFFQLKKIRD